MHASILAAAALASLSGRVTDRTTGQPLVGVHVRAGSHAATTRSGGVYILRGLLAGRHTLRLESNDVPPENIVITLHPGENRRDLKACSTTLDYGCRPARAPAAESG